MVWKSAGIDVLDELSDPAPHKLSIGCKADRTGPIPSRFVLVL